MKSSMIQKRDVKKKGEQAAADSMATKLRTPMF